MEVHLFRAGALELAIKRNENGVALSGIFDRKILKPILSESGALFMLTAERLSDGETVTVASGDGFANSSITVAGKICTVICSDHKALPDVTVTLQLFADEANSRVTFRTAVQSENKDYTLTECDYPILWFDVGDSVKFLSPYGCGEALDSDSELFGYGYRSAQDYPSYGASFQYMATWNESTGRCMYYGVHDPAPAAKKFHFVREVNAPSMYIKGSQPLVEIDRCCNSQTLYGECVWQLLDGDWYDATLLYRDWTRKHAVWMPETDEHGRKDARWLSEIDAWFLVHIYGEDFADEIIDAAKDLGANCGVHLYLWHNNPFDNDYPHYFPEKPTVRRELKKLQDAGIRVIPYINGRLWDTRDRGTEDWQYTEIAYPKACKDRHGKPFNESYSAKEANGEHTVLSVMCPSSALWQDKVTYIVDKLLGDIGFDGVYMDQIAAAKPQLCADRTHGHLPGGGTWWCESYYNLIDHVSRLQSPAVLATECTGEMFMKHIQLYLSWLWVKNQQVPAFPVLYSDKVITFGISYNSFSKEDRDGMCIFYAQSLLFGEQMGWLAPNKYREMPEKEFYKKLVHCRAELRPFFSGTMLRPPKLTDDAPRLRCENTPHAYFKTVDYPAVQGALWQDNASGKKLLMLINAQSVDAHTELETEFPDGTYTMHGDMSGKLIVADGKASLTIPATGIVWVVTK
ncbi:MAG: hypothetical protein IJB88_05290 [Clostridia bacterium]|nr:hypothetical protein [Clostridia bacterium]